MKKKLLPLILFFTIFYLQFNYAQKSNKKVRIFENFDFTFNYPKKWRILKDGNVNNNQIIAIAPINSITSAIILPKDVHADKNHKKTLENYVGNSKYINEFSKNRFDVFIELNTFKTLHEYIINRKKIIETKNNNNDYLIISDIVKINDTLYVENLEIKEKKGLIAKNTIRQNHTIRYLLNDKEIYILTFSVESNKVKKYNNDKEIIFDSFQFKN